MCWLVTFLSKGFMSQRGYLSFTGKSHLSLKEGYVSYWLETFFGNGFISQRGYFSVTGW